MKPIIYSLFQYPLLMPYVVTEYGIVNLQGKSISERALALIQISNPKFQDSLLESAKKIGYL